MCVLGVLLVGRRQTGSLRATPDGVTKKKTAAKANKSTQPSSGFFTCLCRVVLAKKTNNNRLNTPPRPPTPQKKASSVGSQDEHSAKDPHVVTNQLHLVPELHLARVVPVAHVAVYEEDDEGQDGGQDLGRQADVPAGEEGQGQHSEQQDHQSEGHLPAGDVVQVGLPVLLAVLEGIHLVAREGAPLSQSRFYHKDLGALTHYYWNK